MIRSTCFCIVPTLAVLFGASACAKRDRPPVAAGPTSPAPKRAAADTLELWRLAPADLEAGIVVGDGVLPMLKSGATEFVSASKQAPAGSMMAPPLEDWWRSTLAEYRIPSLEELEDSGLDLESGAALFTTKTGFVVLLPLRNREAFVELLGGSSEDGIDTIRDRLWCTVVETRYVCADHREALKAIGKSSIHADKIATWPAAHRGHIEAYVPGDSFADLDLDPVFTSHGALRAAARISRGEIEVNSYLPATGTALASAFAPTDSALATDLLEAKPTAVFLLRLAGLWSRVAPDLIADAPDSEVVPGVRFRDLLSSLSGDLVAYVRPGSQAGGAIKLGLTQGNAFAALIQSCESLAGSMEFLSLRSDGTRCVAGFEVAPGKVFQIVFRVEDDHLLADFPSQGPSAAEKHPLAPHLQQIVEQGFHAGVWWTGSLANYLLPFIRLGGGASLAGNMEMGAAAWLGLQINEFGLAWRVEESGVHGWLHVRTAFSNPPELAHALQSLFSRLLRDPATASSGLQALSEKYPDSNWARDTFDGGGDNFITVTGVIAAVGIPAFMKYIKTSKTEEAMQNLRVLEKAVIDARKSGVKLSSIPRTPPLSLACENSGHEKYDANAAHWETPGWQALHFAIAEEHYYAYDLLKDKSGIVINAYGDLDCDGDYSTFTLSIPARAKQANTGQIVQSQPLE